jgi:hypothetical protein
LLENANSVGEWERERGRGEVAQTMYTYVSKCKNDKIKGEKNNMHKKRECKSCYIFFLHMHISIFTILFYFSKTI